MNLTRRIASFAFLGMTPLGALFAQCPAITCPANIVAFSTGNSCSTAVTYVTPVGTNPCGGNTPTTFNYTGSMQSYTVPMNATTITVDASGAQGGGTAGGNGGRAQATIPVTGGEVLEVWVGGRPTQEVGPGGFNGGGAVVIEPCGSGPTYSWPGGGATDIRRGSGLANRLIVAGGGGGQGWSTGLGGAGGGATGVDGAASWITGTNGKGGSQVAGGLGGYYSGNGQSSPNGTLGVGGNGSPLNTYCTGGGGGGGYYGGGGGYVSAGGGGSSYVANPGNTATSTTANYRAGDGILSITTTGSGSATTTQIAGLASGATFPPGVTTNTFQVSDGLGNSASCSFTVTVNDGQLPIITCPAPITINAAPNACNAVVTFPNATATDNCGAVTVTQAAGLPSGSTFAVGTSSISFGATDAIGLVAYCSFSVTVVDAQAPTITCPANITANTSLNSCSTQVFYTTPIGTDNCAGGGTIRTAGIPSGFQFPLGATTVTYQAYDQSGNTTTCSFTVTVNDAEAPTLVCPPTITVPNTNSACDAIVTYTDPLGVDNCAGVTTSMTTGMASGSTFPVGTTTQTFSAVDAAGNSSTCSFDIVVLDSESPTITCPPNQNVTVSTLGCAAVVNYNTPIGVDNCANPTTTMTSGLASGATFPGGVTVVYYTVTDASGNSASCTFTVTVTGSVSSTQTVAICEGASVTVGTHTYSQPGVYVDTLASTFGCDSIVTTLLSVTVLNSSTTVSGLTITAAATGATYQWLDCGNGMAAIPGATAQSFTATQTGNYAVAVTQNNCTDTSGCSSITVVGVKDGFGNNFSLSPNPSDGLIRLDFGRSYADLEIRVTDLSGKVLMQRKGINGRSASLDLREFSHGVYLVEVRDGELRHTLRMAIQ